MLWFLIVVGIAYVLITTKFVPKEVRKYINKRYNRYKKNIRLYGSDSSFAQWGPLQKLVSLFIAIMKSLTWPVTFIGKPLVWLSKCRCLKSDEELEKDIEEKKRREKEEYYQAQRIIKEWDERNKDK